MRYDGAVIVAGFSEPVSGVGADSVLLKNSTGAVIPAAVSYASSSRRATLRPSAPLAAEATYQVQLTTAIKDAGGNALAASAWSFTTGKSTPRIAGDDRFGTAAAVSRASFDAAVPVVYIADGTTFPDALAGGPAARVGGGPLLLTAPGSLPAATTTELTRLTPGRIVVLGGTGAVSASVEHALDAYTTGIVTRLAGPDRYATAAAVSASAFPAGASVAYVATGETFPDALAAGAAAARAGAPILLVEPNALPGATAAELARLGPDQIVVMGGTGSRQRRSPQPAEVLRADGAPGERRRQVRDGGERERIDLRGEQRRGRLPRVGHRIPGRSVSRTAGRAPRTPAAPGAAGRPARKRGGRAAAARSNPDHHHRRHIRRKRGASAADPRALALIPGPERTR